jgi:hypothetical protein
LPLSQVHVQVEGGLGNQLFMYAAGRALADRIGAELVLDLSPFTNETVYQRIFLLDRFPVRAQVLCREKTLVRKIAKELEIRVNRMLPFHMRWRFEDLGEVPAFDPRMLSLKRRSKISLAGFWQSESYFVDAAKAIANDLRQACAPPPEVSSAGSAIMREPNPVLIHVRNYSEIPDEGYRDARLDRGYYPAAMELLESRVRGIHYFVFSDEIDDVKRWFKSRNPVTFVECNKGRGNDGAVDELWLMSLCRHAVIANSSLSWWGAWLAEQRHQESQGIIIGPKQRTCNADFLPSRWITL